MRYWMFAALTLCVCPPAFAEDLQSYSVLIKDHRFTPPEIHVPAGKAFQIEVINQEEQADEFEMASPPLEKVVQPGAIGKLRVRPLSKGRFEFYDDFHPEVRGAIVAE